MFKKVFRVKKSGRAIGSLNSRGDTLVEVLISMVLFLFIFMAVLSSALLAIDSNTKNMLRNEAVRIAAQSMSGARSIASNAFANMQQAIPVGPVGAVSISRNFRNFAEPFTVTNAVAPLDSSNENYLVSVTVTWSWKGQPQTPYTIQAVISNPAP